MMSNDDNGQSDVPSREAKYAIPTRKFTPIPQGEEFLGLLRGTYIPEIEEKIARLRALSPDGHLEFYHVVGDEWEPGEALHCIENLRAQGRNVPQVATIETHDADVVSLCWSLGEAKNWREEYGPNRRILRLRVPPSVDFTATNEGNPAVSGSICADCVVEIIQ